MPKCNLSERLIPLVRARPEVWDQSNPSFQSKELRYAIWQQIGAILGISGTLAKTRWTNLRDLFRREMRKMVRVAKETGEPDAYRPRWKHFKTMMFLKDQMLTFHPFHDPSSQIILEDGQHFTVGGEFFLDESSNISSDPKQMEMTILPEPCPLRQPIDPEDEPPRPPAKKPKSNPRPSQVESLQQDSPSREEHLYSKSEQDQQHASPFKEVDEDYHFMMSLVPSARRIRKERKTLFRMKLLQLIADEEQAELMEQAKKSSRQNVQTILRQKRPAEEVVVLDGSATVEES